MPHVQRTAVVPYSEDQMFALVAEVERYPEFIPWVKGIRVVSRESNAVVAEFRIGYGPVRAAFTSRAELHPPERIELRLVRGPFSRFEGRWTFEGHPGGGTSVGFELEFEFAGGPLGRLLRPAFSGQIGAVLKAFVERARARYGDGAPGS